MASKGFGPRTDPSELLREIILGYAEATGLEPISEEKAREILNGAFSKTRVVPSLDQKPSSPNSLDNLTKQALKELGV